MNKLVEKNHSENVLPQYQTSSWPFFAEDEIAAANKVLYSGKVNYWTGNECRLFENEFAEFVGAKHAIALANGTLALELALISLDIQAGDEVIVPSRTFIATASAVVARGAIPIVADVDLESQNMTASTIKPLITAKTKAIIVVHLAGWPCDMDEILHLAHSHHLKVIEDCAQAHGAYYKGRHVGTLGDIGAFSFCQDKIITTAGEGGMVVMNNSDYWEKAWAYKDHGKNHKKIQTHATTIGFPWRHDNFGSNYRLTEIQAAIGRKQLEKLASWVKIRNEHAAIFNQAFADLKNVRLTLPPQEYIHAYYKYYLFIRPEKLKATWSRDSILEKITQQNISAFSGICPEIYLENAFIDNKLSPSQRYPNAKLLGETSIMLLVHPTLTHQHISHQAEIIKSILSDAAQT
ncbi:MAG: DegT/DnrJ/EryC1/StrS aminotransferase family protein [Legionellales bacterium]|nr:DegT/DnrJ/EryC1/StrS aminotransferase family protein [Legionellales bacterium]